MALMDTGLEMARRAMLCGDGDGVEREREQSALTCAFDTCLHSNLPPGHCLPACLPAYHKDRHTHTHKARTDTPTPTKRSKRTQHACTHRITSSAFTSSILRQRDSGASRCP